MDYQEALRYIHEISAYDRGFIANPFAGDEAAALGLKRTQLLLDRLDNPESGLAIIHVAGTKGKGSTCAFVESVARHSGLKTGLYTTPHLHSIRERIMIDGEPIAEQPFAAATARAARAVSDLRPELEQFGTLTAFEFVTAMALDIFAQENVQLAIVEVGLGGRLDATNVVVPRVSVITSISFDHEAILGTTLAEIAYEKAGIIKPGAPVVSAVQHPEAAVVIADRGREAGSTLFLAGHDFQIEHRETSMDLHGPWGILENLRPGLNGEHQRENAALAIVALWCFDSSLIRQADAVRQGLATTRWPGRFEIVETKDGHKMVIDGAHNVDSIDRLVSTLNHEFPEKKRLIVFGTSRDKDIDGMIAKLAPDSEHLIAVASSNPRAADTSVIKDSAHKHGLPCTVAASFGDGLDLARQRAGRDTLIVATGSLYVVAEAREALGLAQRDPAGLID